MGLPGSGKTFLAKKIVNSLKADWFNADKIRGKYNDWDFSSSGIIRQVKRMKKLADDSKKKFVVTDFICPLKKQFQIYKPDFIIWMDTIKKSRYPRINKIFQKPKKYDIRVTSKDANLWSKIILDQIHPYKWKNNNPTVSLLGRWQPFHDGHYELFLRAYQKTAQVIIYVKDVQNIGDNPFSFSQIKKLIDKKLVNLFKNRYKVKLAPNITNIFYGRKVGYKIKKINLDKKIQKISGTKIRKQMRAKGQLKQKKINR